MGGVAAEILADTAWRLLPVDADTAAAMISELRGASLLAGHRGRPPAELPALVAAILAFARLGEALGERLIEAEVNPLFVGQQGVLAADGMARLA